MKLNLLYAGTITLSLACLTARAQVVADSSRDFSGTQGGSNWYYGYYRANNTTEAGFVQLEWFSAYYSATRGLGWLRSGGSPEGAPYTAIGYAGAEPNGANDGPQGEEWAVRRYVSAVAGSARIFGDLRRLPGYCGNGVIAEIRVDGQTVLSNLVTTVANVPGLTNYSANVTLAIGSKVDFILRPNQPTDNGRCGYAVFAGIIELTTTSASAPTITNQPQDRVVSIGGSATFTVGASGTPPLSFQWQWNGTDLANATNSSYVIADAQLADAGTYGVRVSNAAGNVLSQSATLSLLDLRTYAGLTLAGPVGKTYQVERATVLSGQTNWIVLTNLTLEASPYRFVDWSSAGSPNRFYRATPLP